MIYDFLVTLNNLFSVIDEDTFICIVIFSFALAFIVLMYLKNGKNF